MNEQQSQQVQVAQMGASATSEPPKWGELPPPERIAALDQRVATWEQMSTEARGVGRNAFDYFGPQGWHGGLTGADVFYLVVRTLLGSSVGLIDIGAAAERLHATGELYRLGLSAFHLERVDLTFAHLEGATFRGAHLEETGLQDAHLEGAVFNEAHLERADLTFAHLEGAHLLDAHLEGADLRNSYLDGASLTEAHLEGTDLRGVSFNKGSHLNEAVFTGARFDQVIFDNTNLTVVDWSLVDILGDELTARERKDRDGKHKSRKQRLNDYKAAVRANRVLAVALRSQGLNEDADRFTYRAQYLQRHVLRRQFRPLQYVGSWLLDVLAGYGYRPARTLFWYAVTIAVFAFLYMQATTGWIPFGLPAPSSFAPLTWYEALILSVSSFHGRGFFQPVQSLGDPIAALAAIEAVLGLFIEISFIATFTQRYFGAR